MTTPVSRRLVLGGLAGLGTMSIGGAIAGCSPAQQNGGGNGNGGEGITLTVRLWDEQVKAAYEEGFVAFNKQNPSITVRTVLVPWADYFTKLRTDVGGGSADDLFLMNGSYIQPYVDSNNLVEIGSDFADLAAGWVPAAVEQYTRNDKLWGVPQLTDGGIAVYYNTALLADAGLTPDDLADLTWAPGGGADDTFLPVVQKLTVDQAGKRGDEAGFDGSNPRQWGYSAAQDLQGIYYNYLGSAGGRFQDDQANFVFDSTQGEDAFSYIVDLINKHKVAPAASNTNNNGDFTRDQFLQGKIALFQSGIYNLKNIVDGADFEWGIAPIPAGPKGRISVVNNVVVCGNAASKHPEAVAKVLHWLGSPEGATFVGTSGAALPAITGAQDAYHQTWETKDVDPAPFATAAEGETIGAPTGANYSAALSAWKPTFDEMFLGRLPVDKALAKAQTDANKAMNG